MDEFSAILGAIAANPDAALVAYVIYQVHQLNKRVTENTEIAKALARDHERLETRLVIVEGKTAMCPILSPAEPPVV